MASIPAPSAGEEERKLLEQEYNGGRSLGPWGSPEPGGWSGVELTLAECRGLVPVDQVGFWERPKRWGRGGTWPAGGALPVNQESSDLPSARQLLRVEAGWPVALPSRDRAGAGCFLVVGQGPLRAETLLL